MFSSTKKFLIKAHEAFDELGYKVKSNEINIDDFENSAVQTLNHSKELEDSLNCIRMYNFVYRKFNEIQKLVYKYSWFWDELKYEGNELIN